MSFMSLSKMIESHSLSYLKRAALLGAILFAPQMAIADSKILVEDTTFNFGLSPQKSKLSRVFWLKSVGEDTLHIFRILPGCGCTQVPLDNYHIAPGDSAKLEIIFSSGKYTGKVIKRPQIQMTDHFMPQLLIIESYILADDEKAFPLLLAPGKLDISQNNKREVSQANFRLENVSDQELQIEVLETSSGYLVVSLPETIGANQSIELIMKIDEKSLQSSFAKSLTFAVTPTGGGARTIYTLPVTRTYRVFEDSIGKPAQKSSRSAGESGP